LNSAHGFRRIADGERDIVKFGFGAVRGAPTTQATMRSVMRKRVAGAGAVMPRGCQGALCGADFTPLSSRRA